MICSPYLTPADLVECDCPQDASPQTIELAIQVASEIEYFLTGKQYPGECEATVRPCGNPGSPLGWSPLFWSFPWVPLRIGGNWINHGPVRLWNGRLRLFRISRRQPRQNRCAEHRIGHVGRGRFHRLPPRLQPVSGSDGWGTVALLPKPRIG